MVHQWLQEPNWIEYVTFGVLVLAVLFEGQSRLRRSWQNRRPFALEFPSDSTPAFEGQEFPKKRTVRLCDGSTQTIYCRVQARIALEVGRFHLRCVATDQGGDIPSDIVQIRQAYDARTQGHQDSVRRTKSLRDGVGGVSVEYEPTPKPLSSKEYFWLGIQLQPHQKWHGFLSLEGYDANGDRRICTARFSVVD
jgi:hypothetical protein